MHTLFHTHILTHSTYSPIHSLHIRLHISRQILRKQITIDLLVQVVQRIRDDVRYKEPRINLSQLIIELRCIGIRQKNELEPSGRLIKVQLVRIGAKRSKILILPRCYTLDEGFERVDQAVHELHIALQLDQLLLGSVLLEQLGRVW